MIAHATTAVRRLARRARRARLVPLLASIAVAAAACTSRSRTADPSSESHVLRVVTYNIHAGKDASQHPNLERVAAVLDSLHADVVLLQEVDRGTERSGGVDQVAELERLTGMHGAFAKSLDFQGGDYGIAALSRWSIQSTETVPLPTDPHADRGVKMYEPRVAIHLVVSTPVGPLHVAGTHLGAESANTFRDQEAQALLEHLRSHVPPAAAVVIGGDFNSTPDSDVHARFSDVFSDSWHECGTGDGFTFPADSAVRRIDYLYSRGLRCTTAAVADTRASDHRPLVVTFGIDQARNLPRDRCPRRRHGDNGRRPPVEATRARRPHRHTASHPRRGREPAHVARAVRRAEVARWREDDASRLSRRA